MRYFKLLLIVLFFFTIQLFAQEKHSITFDDFIKIKRINSLKISPDGKWIAFVITEMNKEKNNSNTDIWITSTDGGELKRITTSENADFNPEWSPDSNELAFISTRSGSPQIWKININGGEAKQITNIHTGVSGIVWSPDGKYFLFSSSVYPDCKNDKEKLKSKVKAKIFNELLYRHWNSWRDGKYNHLFIISSSGKDYKDLTPGKHDVPPISLGGSIDYSFSPDGKEICFTMNEEKIVATSTNNDLFIITVDNKKTIKITNNPANDNSPKYSPDGKYIAYRAQMVPGFESDRYRLMLYNRKNRKIKNLTENFDRWVGDFTWAPDSKKIYFTADDMGFSPVYSVSIEGNDVKKIIDKTYNTNLNITPDGQFLIFARQSLNHPVDIYKSNINGSNVIKLTDINKNLLDEIEMNKGEEFWYSGAGGTKIHGFLLKPPFFDLSKKYPMVFLIHGGPQGSWSDQFHYRWNAQMFASPGFVVVMTNPRGSTGYGQKFINEISGDWGGKCYIDLMNGVDYVLENFPFIDREKIAAAGASFGGYMINWIEGHTNRFKCLISHDGIFNLTSFYFATEELWFPEWEFKGTPWTNKQIYEKFSPHNYVQNFKTPMLIIHGEQDFRVTVGEGIQLFTALQRMGVPSKLIYFPDEGHFVTKPLNAELWYKNIHLWLKKYLK
ncbi:S9 family peptidase [candidate division KSB1 bacterium]|nr:MAG: S9 family peptidase [candidate division KSB1 bacterium]